jgi:hypothetical protein
MSRSLLQQNHGSGTASVDKLNVHSRIMVGGPIVPQTGKGDVVRVESQLWVGADMAAVAKTSDYNNHTTWSYTPIAPLSWSTVPSTVSHALDLLKAGGVISFQSNVSGLTPTTATTGVVTLDGTLEPTSGGTGSSLTLAIGDLLVASATNAMVNLAAGPNNQVLTSNGPGVAPSWQVVPGGAGSDCIVDTGPGTTQVCANPTNITGVIGGVSAMLVSSASSNVQYGYNSLPNAAGISNTVAIGDSAATGAATGSNNVFMGNNIVADNTSTDMVIIGQGSTCLGDRGVLIGKGSSINATGNTQCVLIGSNSTIATDGGAFSASNCVLVGNSANCTGNACVAIGQISDALSGGVAVGRQANAGSAAVGMGSNARSHGDRSISIGAGTTSASYRSIAIGGSAVVAGGGTIAATSVSSSQALPPAGGILNVVSTAGFSASGIFHVDSSAGPQIVTYTGITATSFTGCTGGTGTVFTFSGNAVVERGLYAISIGGSSIANNISGSEAIAIGRFSTSNGERNIAIGTYASVNQDCEDCISIGHRAQSNTGGIDNVAIGHFAQPGTGAHNICIGRSVGAFASSGSDNTMIGFQAGNNITTGTNNTLIGSGAGDVGVSPGGVIIAQNDQIILGNTSVTNAWIQVPFVATSDARDKMNFAEIPHGLEFVEQLKPTSFQFKKSRDNKTPHGPVRYGFKAQDVLALEGENPVIVNNNNSDHLGLGDASLTPILVNAIKELSQLVKNLQQEIAELKAL